MSAKNIDEPDFENPSSENVESSYDEAYEDDTTYTEDDSDEWADDVDLSDEAGEEGGEPAPKKKTSNLTIAIILVVAVIGVFGFMVLKGSNTSAPPPAGEGQVAINAEVESDTTDGSADSTTPQPNMTDLKNQADQDTQADQTITIKSPTPAQPQQGLMENPDLLASDTNVEPAPVMTADQPSTLTAPAAPDTAPAGQPTVPQSQEVLDVISPSVKPVSDFPTVDSIKKPDIADKAPVPVVTATDSVAILPVPTQTPVQEVAQDDASAKLQVQVNDAQEKIALLEKQLSNKSAELEAQKQIAAKAAATPVAPTGASGLEIDALRGKIADLEEKLATQSTKKLVPEREIPQENSYSTNEIVIKKPVATIKQKVATKQLWALKSASAGKAILSDKATGDLKTVRVGDVVSGLGRIVSISSHDSAWSVKGTSGSVFE